MLGRLLEVPTVAACLLIGAAACGSTSSSTHDREIRTLLRDSDRFSQAHVRLEKALGDCRVEAQVTGLHDAADVFHCMDHALAATNVQPAVETFRKQVIRVGQHGSEDCKRAADSVAQGLSGEEAAWKALHIDFVKVDTRGFVRDTRHPRSAAAIVRRRQAMVRACF